MQFGFVASILGIVTLPDGASGVFGQLQVSVDTNCESNQARARSFGFLSRSISVDGSGDGEDSRCALSSNTRFECAAFTLTSERDAETRVNHLTRATTIF